MTLQKLIINIKKKLKGKKKKRNLLILNKVEQTSFIKKRHSFIIKNNLYHQIKKLGYKKNYYYTIISIFIVSLPLYIFFGPIFKINNIEIIKQDNITNMIISYKAVENYRGQSIWLPEKNEILKRLQNYQHNIRSIDIDIVVPSTLKILINSYKGLFNTTINDKSFIITENGTLIPSEYSEDFFELKIINKFDKSKFLDYKKVLDTIYLAKILNVSRLLKENIINLKINEITYYIIERELHIKIGKKTILIFNLDLNIKEQIEKLSIFNREHLNINKNTIMYIDLRIKNKVFYCTIEEEYKCIQNLKSIYSYE